MKRIFYKNEKKLKTVKTENQNSADEIYILNSDEEKAILEAQNQIKNGQFLTDKETHKDIIKLLKRH